MESVESLCNQLARQRLLAPDVIRELRNRWRAEMGAAADDPRAFRKWLVRGGEVTAFQLDFLERGYGDFLHFADYLLLDRIGQGRMAGVYKAKHPLGQTVAIKVLPPSKAKHPRYVNRFQREARLAVRLDHDNVVRTFQSGQHRAMHFLVMEYLDGETLEDILQRRPRLGVEEVTPILVQALHGLAHLDELGMVHRDIKPGNLMLVGGEGVDLAKTTSGATLKILDIGLGRALFDEGGPGPDEEGEVTRDGAILGTLNYMAPEQARSARTADIRADIYGLGCVAYEMLSGRAPFADANMARQIRRHAEEPHQPLRALAPGLPAALEAIIDKMLTKDPALRYAVPGEALRDLGALITPPTRKPHPERPMRSYLTWLDTQRRVKGEDPPNEKPLNPVEEPMATAPMAAVNGTPNLPWAEPVIPEPPILEPLITEPAPPNLSPWSKFVLRIRSFGWHGRDWIIALLGAAVLLLFQGLIWLLIRLAGF